MSLAVLKMAMPPDAPQPRVIKIEIEIWAAKAQAFGSLPPHLTSSGRTLPDGNGQGHPGVVPVLNRKIVRDRELPTSPHQSCAVDPFYSCRFNVILTASFFSSTTQAVRRANPNFHASNTFTRSIPITSLFYCCKYAHEGPFDRQNARLPLHTPVSYTPPASTLLYTVPCKNGPHRPRTATAISLISPELCPLPL
ncbi:hypothetical protein LY78DRAFT_465268 [Colletotrichum sublineola]|nr:hypothetical protein LY78DRAFT_465268 [Colletotrichum sublineola]